MFCLYWKCYRQIATDGKPKTESFSSSDVAQWTTERTHPFRQTKISHFIKGNLWNFYKVFGFFTLTLSPRFHHQWWRDVINVGATIEERIFPFTKKKNTQKALFSLLPWKFNEFRSAWIYTYISQSLLLRLCLCLTEWKMFEFSHWYTSVTQINTLLRVFFECRTCACNLS